MAPAGLTHILEEDQELFLREWTISWHVISEDAFDADAPPVKCGSIARPAAMRGAHGGWLEVRDK